MTRLVPHTDMTAAQLADCSRQASAIMILCESAAWEMQNGGVVERIADAICQGQKLAAELLEPVQDALERHERVTGEAPEGTA
ncbi:hypothetical protein ACSBOB_01710 [Mesorhizobium sp. ASY16-5R]|uniref:hypothetical protein n=1 Tax=Mesorhizobium sp. ASY16-5R TaxID=3445772 RepID=UPI003FA10983